MNRIISNLLTALHSTPPLTTTTSNQEDTKYGYLTSTHPFSALLCSLHHRDMMTHKKSKKITNITENLAVENGCCDYHLVTKI